VSDHDHDHDHESRTRVPVPVAKLDDPHMGDMAQHPRRIEAIVGALFLLAIVMMGGFAAAYWEAWNPWILGATMGGGLFLLGFGLTAWGKYLMPQGPFVEERHPLRSTDEERESIAAALVERSSVVVKRRQMLFGLFALGSGIFGLIAVFPLKSLGPLPKKLLEGTDWKKGVVLVDNTGRTFQKDSLAPGSAVTVYPQGRQNTDDGQAIDQTFLIRVPGGNLVTMPGRETWAPEGYVAYSKLCTHLGCPVGLYEKELELLVCPCHQSMFNVLNGAVPQFGPAPRPLPQLPLMFDDDGNLAAQAGYDQAVGPGFWERTTT
jgi:ubiquinol-cytochrome c reductase iron-sulfur subunit